MHQHSPRAYHVLRPALEQSEGFHVSLMSMTFGYHSVNELAGVEDTKTILVRGERIYQGNDRR
ncbi:hypothetical protein HYR99_20945 [Candidatus Poribacteria bacterium]|nr:hypothetical protein [Candidatus Poribacteria bacterium]